MCISSLSCYTCLLFLNTYHGTGYDLYGSALADILTEPSLSVPITVGLYAKWGSGKSFLLKKLRWVGLLGGTWYLINLGCSH